MDNTEPEVLEAEADEAALEAVERRIEEVGMTID